MSAAGASTSPAPLIALGVTGGIAAYKACDLVRRLRDEGYRVQVVMTEAAQRFVTPLTFETLSGLAVITHGFDAASWSGDPSAEPPSGIQHIGVARSAALVLIAPATANIIGKIAHGIADDFLSTLCTATEAPILLCPSMNTLMWQSKAVQENVRTLRSRGVRFVAPGVGSLACGEVGEGRLAEVPDIVASVRDLLRERRSLSGLRVTVNGGPTREHLDAVRFLSNASTGKQAIALAEAARGRGAEVTLVLGPTTLPPPAGVTVVRVTSAAEMLAATLEAIEGCRIAVLAAAVSDFAPASREPGKVKKNEAARTLELERTPDILLSVATSRRPPVLVGFAAEAGDPLAEAQRKCLAKGCDLVVGNDVTAADSGFGTDTNRAVLAFAGGRTETTPLLYKIELAHLIWDRCLEILERRAGALAERSGESRA